MDSEVQKQRDLLNDTLVQKLVEGMLFLMRLEKALAKSQQVALHDRNTIKAAVRS